MPVVTAEGKTCVMELLVQTTVNERCRRTEGKFTAGGGD